ncbi:MAG: hypothetical protein GY861_06495 [bacterium]|nr:hypothetical protein [bacterium]
MKTFFKFKGEDFESVDFIKEDGKGYMIGNAHLLEKYLLDNSIRLTSATCSFAPHKGEHPMDETDTHYFAQEVLEGNCMYIEHQEGRIPALFHFSGKLHSSSLDIVVVQQQSREFHNEDVLIRKNNGIPNSTEWKNVCINPSANWVNGYIDLPEQTHESVFSTIEDCVRKSCIVSTDTYFRDLSEAVGLANDLNKSVPHDYKKAEPTKLIANLLMPTQ